MDLPRELPPSEEGDEIHFVLNSFEIEKNT